MGELTQAQQDALKWLRDHGGDGVLMRGNTLLAQGEVAPHEWKTWKALELAGLCERYKTGRGRRLRIKDKAND